MNTKSKPVFGVIIPADGDADVQKFSALEDYKNAVGGYIEVVGGSSGIVALANENGRSLKLPYNEKASALLGLDLLGPVVLIGEGEDDWASIPASTIADIIDYCQYSEVK